jgi:hypothetical protein
MEQKKSNTSTLPKIHAGSPHWLQEMFLSTCVLCHFLAYAIELSSKNNQACVSVCKFFNGDARVLSMKFGSGD